MPELPDVTVYCEAIQRMLVGQRLQEVVVKGPSLLKTVSPPLSEFVGKELIAASRLAKQIVLHFEDQTKLLAHLMIAGRFKWQSLKQKVPKSLVQAVFTFETGRLLFTEAGKKKRARLYALSSDPEELARFDRGGLEVLEISLSEFAERLTLRNHTLRRALTDQNLFSGIGNAYSDEICFAAKLSPLALTQKLSEKEVAILYSSCRRELEGWTRFLRVEVGNGFPKKVTAFREEMRVHGKYGQKCPQCESKIQRIRYAKNETNYCPTCQNEGRLLADRSLSRLLKSDWPKTAEELELHFETRKLRA